MCGLTGIFGVGDKQTPNRDCLNHRGPDAFGLYEDEHIVIAHNRLAIIDLDKRSDQPMQSSQGQYWIVFNGEIYNYQSLKNNLLDKGVTFTTKSDTEVILKGFEIYGMNWFKQLNGMFAIAIYDRINKCVTLARDRFGIKPLYYYIANGLLHFGSEQRAFKSNPSIAPKKVSRKAFVEYLHYGYSLEDSSFLDNVAQIPPGSIMTKSLSGQPVISKFYSFPVPSFKKNLSNDLNVILKNIRQLIIESIEKQFVSDVPVSILLSSGIDSNIIAHVAARELGLSPTTYTAQFELGKLKDDEADIAKLSAKMAGLEHNIVNISVKNLPTVLQKIVSCYEEPFGDPAAIPCYLLASEISKNEKVVLQGDGGDEFFGGYNRYSRLDKARSYKRLAAIFYSFRHFAKVSPDLYKKFRFFGCFKADSDARFLSALMTHEMYGFDYKSLLASEFKHFFEDVSVEEKYFESLPYKNQDYSLADLSMYVDKQIILPSSYLRKVDRATMAFGLESRVPFLDNKVAEYMCSLPADLILGGNSTPKFLLKKAFEDILPNFVVSSKKRGFTVPFAEWLRDPLFDFTFEKFRLNNHIFSKKVYQLLSEHKKRNYDHSYILWKLLMFCLWNEANGQL